MPTVEEFIENLKDTDADMASQLSKLVEDRDNFKTQSRRWETQAKANMQDAEAKRSMEKELEELRNQKNVSSEDSDRIKELEKKIADYDELKSKYTQLEKERTRETLVRKVARDKSIPDRLSSYLRGDTEEELTTSAEQLREDMALGVVKGWANPSGSGSNGTIASGKDLFKEYNQN